MAKIWQRGGLTSLFLKLASQLDKRPYQGAVDVYNNSSLKSYVDAIATLSGATRDADGSFQSVLEDGGEKLAITFNQVNDPADPLVAFKIKATREIKEVFPGGTMTSSNSHSTSYELKGNAVSLLSFKLFGVIPLFGPLWKMLEPESFKRGMEEDMAQAIPTLHARITAQAAGNPAP